MLFKYLFEVLHNKVLHSLIKPVNTALAARNRMRRKLKKIGDNINNEIDVYRILSRDKRIPKISKILMGSAVLYLLSPIDLIRDIIPVIGHLDDLVIIPLLIYLALKFIPAEVVEVAR